MKLQAYKKSFTGCNNATYDLSDYKTFKELFRDICYRNMSINEAEQKQEEFDGQRLDSPATPDSSTDESHGLTGKVLQMFKKLFSYKNPGKLEEALIRVDAKEKYNDLLNDLNIKRTVLRDQIKTKIGVSRTRLENLANVVKNILDNVGLNDNMPDLESEESAAQGQSAKKLKILTPNQMLNRLPVYLAQLNAGNNSENLKNEIKQFLYSLYRSNDLTKQIYKSLIDII